MALLSRPVFSVAAAVLFAAGHHAARSENPPPTSQVLLSVADSWSSKQGKLQGYQRDKKSGEWKPAFPSPITVNFGRNGLGWGRGVLSAPSGAAKKREGDGKAPAGYFAITKVFGYASGLPRGADFPYRQVGKWDAWPDDPKNPYYNRHVVVDPKEGVPSWFDSQKMRHGDFAYKWLIEIRHNADPPKAGAGSAIFFHVRRGPTRYTAGCTSMRESDLVKIIKWLRSDANPHYVLLPKSEYKQLREPWNLP